MVKVNNIPSILASIDRWGLWDTRKDDKGRLIKYPYIPVDEPELWTAFDKVTVGANTGLGFCVTGLDGFVFGDIDACMEDGILADWAREILDQMLPTYTEVSPSGTGLRFVYQVNEKVADRQAKYPQHPWVNGKEPGYEVYGGSNKGRFLTMTGDVFDGMDTIELLDGLEFLDFLELFPKLVGESFGKGDGGEGAPDRPEELPEVDPAMITEAKDARAFWLGEEGMDRSDAVFHIAKSLVAQFGEAAAYWLMVEHEGCMAVALDHRRNDENKAEEYLWWNCVKAAVKKHKVVRVADQFDDLGPGEEDTISEITRLSKLSLVDYELVRKEAAAKLGMRPTVLDAAVKGQQQGGTKKVTDGYTRNNKGQVLNTPENISKALSDPRIGLTLGFDTFRDEVMFYERPGEWQSLPDTMIWEIRVRMGTIIGFEDTSAEKTRSAIHHAAWKNRFDSAQVWLSGLKWDGVPRVDTFCSRYLGAEDSDYTRAVGRYIWTGAAGRIIEPGCKVDSAVVLVSPEGRRKSSAVKAMCPDDAFFTELNLHKKDEDISRQLRGKLIGEWGELAGMSKKEVVHVKMFSARQTEAWTPKYKEFETKFPRRCIFIGTTNETEFLVSDTGNRRFYPMRIDECDFEAVNQDRDQLWAEGAILFNQVGVAWQEPHRLGLAYQLEHEVQETEFSDKIQQWLDAPWFTDVDLQGGTNADREDLTSLLIGEEALGLKVKEIHFGVRARITRAMKQLGWRIREVWVPKEHRNRKFYRRNGECE